MKISPFKKFCTPANAVSSFENRHFLSHRPPMKFMNKWPAQRENFLRYMLFSFKIIKAKHVLLKRNRHFLQDRPPSGRSEFYV